MVEIKEKKDDVLKYPNFQVKEKKSNNQRNIIICSVIFASVVLIMVAYIVFVDPIMELKQKSFEVNQFSSIEKPYTVYQFKNVTDDVEIKGNVDFNKIGEYEVEYIVPKLFGKYNVKQTVKVVDTTAPTITLNGDKVYYQSYASEYVEPGYSVQDNYDENLENNVNISREVISDTEFNIVYTVSDSSGNIAVEKRSVHIIDDIPPEIKLNGNEYINILLNGEYQENGATAYDEKDGDLTSQIQISGSVDTATIGAYEIQYKVCDSKGNEAVRTRKVTVYEQKETIKTDTQSGQNGKNGKKGVIYLTFDDGPSESITPQILNILKEKNVKATFFVINYNDELANLVKREHNEGHMVAIHSYSHNYSEIYQSEEAFMNSITRLQEKIQNTIGVSPTIIRFPGGSSNTISRRYNPGIMTRLTVEVLDKGFRYFDWNVDSNDAGNAKNSDDVYRNVANGLKHDRANVVLMHDFSGNTKTLNALSDIIDFGLENGYTFSALTEDTAMVTHSVNN